MSLPPTNHFANGASDQSNTSVNGVCHDNRFACLAQKLSRSTSASQYSSSVPFAWAANSSDAGSVAWASAHVLPGVFAVSALHHYAGLPHHQHIGKHLWMLAVFVAAIIALGVWTLRRRQARTGLRPGAGPT